MPQENKLYLSNAYIEGFRSLKESDVDFKAGLNIIIGKNSAGKTNLLSFLNQALNSDYGGLGNFKSILQLTKDDEKLQIIAKRNISVDSNTQEIFPDLVDIKVSRNNQLLTSEEEEELLSIGPNSSRYINTYIQHGVPLNFSLIDKPLNIDLNRNGVPDNIFNFVNSESGNSYFVKKFFSKFLFSNSDLKITEIDTNPDDIISNIKVNINKFSNESISEISPFLIKFSPIQQVKLCDNFNVFYNEKLKQFSITNLFFEFLIEDNWYLFSKLSDGTKRLFYIISEITSLKNVFFSKKRISAQHDSLPEIILVEEPELGVHPHQLHLLMSCIKEQSLSKQIILTTHSPQVMDFIDADELDRITIAYFDKNKGTKYRKLKDFEKDKAKSYMEEDSLSDYWRFSDLENSEV